MYEEITEELSTLKSELFEDGHSSYHAGNVKVTQAQIHAAHCADDLIRALNKITEAEENLQ